MLNISISAELAAEHPRLNATGAAGGREVDVFGHARSAGRAGAGKSAPADTVARMASTAPSSIGTIALADQLRFLRERVPLSEADVRAATGAEKETVLAWLERRAAPAGEEAARLSELVAACERLEVSTRPDAIPDWLNRSVPMLEGRTPLAAIAAGDYELVAGIAEDLIDPPFT
jgi:DNA-binding transcriptional regulator YiaG